MDKDKFSRKLLIKPRYLKGIEWADRCETLIHFMFEHLCLFVENEMHIVSWFENKEEVKESLKHTVPGSDRRGMLRIIKGHQHAKKEIDFLYIWWNEVRPVYFNADPFTDAFYKKHPKFKSDKKWGKLKEQYISAIMNDAEFDMWRLKTDKDMMKRLVDIKEYLWS
jgi:hypothetical protein